MRTSRRYTHPVLLDDNRKVVHVGPIEEHPGFLLPGTEVDLTDAEDAAVRKALQERFPEHPLDLP